MPFTTIHFCTQTGGNKDKVPKPVSCTALHANNLRILITLPQNPVMKSLAYIPHTLRQRRRQPNYKPHAI